jgi:hypothetical protein
MLEVKRSLKLYYLFSKVNKGDGTNDWYRWKGTI